MFIAALFTTAKTWKQPKCPLIDECIRKMWCVCMCVCIYIYTHTHTHIHTHVYLHIHTMEYYSTIKKDKIMPFAATWMDLEIIILTEVSQTEKDKYHIISLKCGI